MNHEWARMGKDEWMGLSWADEGSRAKGAKDAKVKGMEDDETVGVGGIGVCSG